MTSKFRNVYNTIRALPPPAKLYVTGGVVSGVGYMVTNVYKDYKYVTETIKKDKADGLNPISSSAADVVVSWAPMHVFGGVLFGLTWSVAIPLAMWEYYKRSRPSR